MSEMGDMKFTTAGDMMMDLPTRIESWAQNEELVTSGVMTAHGQDCMDIAEQFRAGLFLIDEYQTELIECHNYIDKLRAENEKLRPRAIKWAGIVGTLIAERDQLIGALQIAVEKSGDMETAPAWVNGACSLLNRGFLKVDRAALGENE